MQQSDSSNQSIQLLYQAETSARPTFVPQLADARWHLRCSGVASAVYGLTGYTDMLQSIGPPDRFPVSSARLVDEQPLFRQWHPHVLLVGDDATSARRWRGSTPSSSTNQQWRPAVATNPPRVTSGALIIWGVDALSTDQQHHLLAWMTGPGAKYKIISISERQLFPRVWQKAFLDDLYYRLNMVCLALDDRPADPQTTQR